MGEAAGLEYRSAVFGEYAPADGKIKGGVGGLSGEECAVGNFFAARQVFSFQQFKLCRVVGEQQGVPAFKSG